MAIQNSDKLLVGRGDTSYHVTFTDSGIAKTDNVVPKTGGQFTGRVDVQPSSGVALRVAGGFAMKSGVDIDGENLFYSGPDYVSYTGVATDDEHITNKKYVDDSVNTKMPRNINTLPLLST
jgi:hypothetical protein